VSLQIDEPVPLRRVYRFVEHTQIVAVRSTLSVTLQSTLQFARGYGRLQVSGGIRASRRGTLFR